MHGIYIIYWMPCIYTFNWSDIMLYYNIVVRQSGGRYNNNIYYMGRLYSRHTHNTAAVTRRTLYIVVILVLIFEANRNRSAYYNAPSYKHTRTHIYVEFILACTMHYGLCRWFGIFHSSVFPVCSSLWKLRNSERSQDLILVGFYGFQNIYFRPVCRNRVTEVCC